MYELWSRNIAENLDVVRRSAGPKLVIIVSGSSQDRDYWAEHLGRTSPDVFRQDGRTCIASVYERFVRGNFLGTFNAWGEAQQDIAACSQGLPDVALMSMVFGKGTRLSPFTQALGNRKPAFPTPMKGDDSQEFLRTVDLANLYANSWIQHLGHGGFRGLIVKWGDEAVIPGVMWETGKRDYHEIDAIRFVWLTEPTEDLAREKEWVVIDAQTGLMRYQFSRQDLSSLRGRVAELEGDVRVGVNLGSLAISYDFLDIAMEVLREDIPNPERWVNWDPYVWVALSCQDLSAWEAEAEQELRLGRTGIKDLEARYPDFFEKVARIRQELEARKGRPLAVSVLDFGETFWADLGLHLTLRQTMDTLTAETPRGRATRDLFGIPHERDEKGNILLRSSVPEAADIRESVIVDSTVLDASSVIHRGVVVGGRHRRLSMPEGGCALFCAVDHLSFREPHGIAFRSLGEEIVLPEGGRHTTLLLPGRPEHMVANESVVDYKGQNYTTPILGNPLSFEEAGEIMSEIDPRKLEKHWRQMWQGWLAE